MERPTSIDRCQQSIVAIIFVVALHLSLTNIVFAAESANKNFTTVARVDSNIAGSLGTQSVERKPSAQQNVQIENEVFCLALNIYFEARSEAEQGQLAVGHVVMNRVADRHFPSTVCNVVKQGGEDRRYRCQFSWWCDGQPDRPLNQKAWLNSLQLAIEVYFGHSEDPTDGALWYHADYVNPGWSDALILGNKIGQHVFYLKKKQPKYALN
ncbi:MAG: cell wall hydrolase [Sedimenticolaceae bacterium]